MGLFNYFSNVAETKERHEKRAFQTHYFKTSYAKTKDALLRVAEAHQWTLKSENDTYGEFFFRGKKHHLIATLIQTSPAETAVDLKVQTYYIAGFNRPQKIIERTFQALAADVPLKGTGLKA